MEVPGVKQTVEGRLPIGLQVANLPHKKNYPPRLIFLEMNKATSRACS